MSKPIQHHYLPKNAYLKYFETSEKPGFVWFYQRREEPILVSTSNLAKERHLYSFIDERGEQNTDLETAFTEMEVVVSGTIEKLNMSDGSILISAQEKSELAYFLAMQFVRTPAFRNTLERQAAELVKTHMKMFASNEGAFKRALEETKKEKPDMPEVSYEDMREFVFGEKYTINMGNKNYFLKQAIQVGDHIFPTVMMKDMFILKSKSVGYITSDYPVNLISHPGIPAFFRGGFLMSDIIFPIGRHTALFCKNPDKPKEPPNKDEKISIGYREVQPEWTKEVNKITINHADRFLFGA
ncbi:MAG: hypothetical protein RIQ62_1586, partial [Bacteroidota bacterium]